MNIFVLDKNPYLAAQMHCDKHVGNMLRETAQMLSTAIWPFLVTQEELANWKTKDKALRKITKERYKTRTGLYLPTHSGHPCTKWACETQSNFEWLYQLGCGLHDEWQYRRNKTHACAEIVYRTYKFKHFLPKGPLTPFAQAFKKSYPHLIDENNPIEAYRKFYIADKSRFAKWVWRRPAPDWWPDERK